VYDRQLRVWGVETQRKYGLTVFSCYLMLSPSYLTRPYRPPALPGLLLQGCCSWALASSQQRYEPGTSSRRLQAPKSHQPLNLPQLTTAKPNGICTAHIHDPKNPSLTQSQTTGCSLVCCCCRLQRISHLPEWDTSHFWMTALLLSCWGQTSSTQKGQQRGKREYQQQLRQSQVSGIDNKSNV